VIDREAWDRYLAHLLGGDRRACRELVGGLLAQGTPARELYQELFQATLYAVGERWQRGQASVAVEHLATAITEDLLSLVFPGALAQPRNGRSAVVSCAADEFHQVGGRIVADSLEASGWRVRFVGANTPVEELLGLVRETGPQLLALSVTIGEHLPVALRTVRLARAAAPALRIIVGGQAFGEAAAEAFTQVPGVQRVASLDELDQLLAGWGA
jgi:methanogenic corrinoid protein MtbC1